MKLQILSDLHIEFADFSIPDTDADVLVLAGDIGVGQGGLQWLHDQKIEKPVIYVPGNHEYYNHDLSLLDNLKLSAKENVKLLNDDLFVIGDVRFLGSTLWTDFDYYGTTERHFAIKNAGKNMADFEVIKNNGKTFRPQDAIKLHNQSRDWIQRMLDQPFTGKTVVVTHHAPSSLSVHPRYENNILTAAFASRLESMMEGGRIALWIHGHMHDAFDYEIYGTRVVCNPRGYVPFEDPAGFVSNLVVEV